MDTTKNELVLKQKEMELQLETQSFDLEQRRAKLLSVSAFFPDSMKNDVASAVIVYDLAKRMNVSVMEVAQSIYIIYNKPSFSTQFLVARLNTSGLIKGNLKTHISEDKQSCYCSSIDATTEQEIIGITITMEIAKAEKWIDKAGSKWKTMPELMLRKRAQSFFIKEFYPEVMFGVQTQEELVDVGAEMASGMTIKETPQEEVENNTASVEMPENVQEAEFEETKEPEKEADPVQEKETRVRGANGFFNPKATGEDEHGEYDQHGEYFDDIATSLNIPPASDEEI